MAVVILDEVQVLDEQIAPARPINEERLHLFQRLWIDLASLGRARRAAPPDTGRVRQVLCPVLVGREEETARLRAALTAAGAGRGGTVLVTGEAGIGKSRLIRETAHLARERDWVVLAGRAVAGGVPTPFRPFAEALAPAGRAGRLPDHEELDTFRPVLGRLIPQWRQQQAPGDDSLVFLGEAVLQLLMETDVEGLIGAGRYERGGERTTWRNGHRDRVFDTRLGSLQLRIPKLRQGSYFPPFLEARKVSEKALIAVIQEAWIGGVSTRRVDELVQAMGLSGIGKSQVSKLCKDIDERVHAFLDRPLLGEWPYLWLDATYLKQRERILEGLRKAGVPEK